MRLCDFGFAVELDASQSGGPPPLQDGCGTVMYMAPELVGKSLKATHSFPVDWWALGCVLVELITGKQAYIYIYPFPFYELIVLAFFFNCYCFDFLFVFLFTLSFIIFIIFILLFLLRGSSFWKFRKYE